MISVAHQLKIAKANLSVLRPQFEMGGQCWGITLPGSGCDEKRLDLKQWNGIEQTALANYSFMMLETSEGFLWESLSETGKEALSEGEINIGNLSDSSITKALGYYDTVLGNSLQASLSAVDTICEDMEEAGLSVLDNPMLSQSFFQIQKIIKKVGYFVPCMRGRKDGMPSSEV